MTENPCGQEQQAFHQGERRAHAHAQEEDRQRQQPNQWRQNQHDQGDRPAQHQQDAPRDEKNE